MPKPLLLPLPFLVSLAALFVALVASLLVRAIARQRREEARWPFTVQTPLSQVEQILYYRLVRTLPDLVILPQVPLSRFLRVKLGRTWREWHNRISRKSIDYLICDRDFAIIAAVELDDRSHERVDRAGADMTKIRALGAAGIPLVRWRAVTLPDADTIRAVVDDIRRQRFGDVGVVAPDQVAPSVNASRIDASNDPTMFTQDKRQ